MIFARYPELGRVKSRLATSVGDQAALELYRAMVEDLLDGIGRSDDETEVEIVWTGGENIPGRDVAAFFRDYPLTMQSGATLGDRLSIAFSERVIFHDVTKVIAIGTDDPALTRGEVDRAFALLDSCDWTIGPAHDGGYYLIGARTDAYKNSIFRDIDWGTATVFDSTLTAVRRMRASVAVLPRRFDIDHEADLRALVQSGRATPHLLAAAERLEVG
jgi:uncharacterized protein